MVTMTRASDLIREKSGEKQEPMRLSDIDELRSGADGGTVLSEQENIQIQKDRADAEKTYRALQDFILEVKGRVIKNQAIKLEDRFWSRRGCYLNASLHLVTIYRTGYRDGITRRTFNRNHCRRISIILIQPICIGIGEVNPPFYCRGICIIIHRLNLRIAHARFQSVRLDHQFVGACRKASTHDDSSHNKKYYQHHHNLDHGEAPVLMNYAGFTGSYHGQRGSMRTLDR